MPQATNSTAYFGGSGNPAGWELIEGLRFYLDYEDPLDIETEMENETSSLYLNLEDDEGDFIIYDEDGNKAEYEPYFVAFHAPSEHTVDGKHYDLEMQIVNSNPSLTEMAAISVFFDTKVGGTTESLFLKGLLTAKDNGATVG